jgi:hypothetical protein
MLLKYRPNFLFSTTRQWNVGDEFVCMGVKQLLQESGLSFNTLIYNRNPQISPPRLLDRLPWVRGRRLHENSLVVPVQGIVDAVIFAGSPEWRGGSRMMPLLRWVLDEKIPALFLGMGSTGAFTLKGPVLEIVKELSLLITCRDSQTYECVAKAAPTHLLPCPSMFSCGTRPRRRTIEKVGRIAVIMQAAETAWQSAPAVVGEWLLDSARSLARNHEVRIVGHFIDDVILANAKGLDIAYSGDAADYPALVSGCDLVISTRVHACGLATSLGIPSICVRHDARSDTAQTLGAIVVNEGCDLGALIDSTDWQRQADELAASKERALEEYLLLLRNAFASMPAVPRRKVLPLG